MASYLGKRLRPIGKQKYKVNCGSFSYEFELNNHQRWRVESYENKVYTLLSSDCIVKITIDEEKLPKIFDTSEAPLAYPRNNNFELD